MKIGILTIFDNNNYGNRLQNYASQQILKKLGFGTYTFINDVNCNFYEKYFVTISKKIIKKILMWRVNFNRNLRTDNFKKFNDNIDFYKRNINILSKIDELDYVIAGSDQIWNPNFDRLSPVDLLCFVKPDKRIAFSASFGVNDIPDKMKKKVGKALKSFKAISVRENAGKKIVDELTGRTDVEVLIDPTMLLTADEWDKVSKKPTMLKNDRYILNYFLGNLSDERRNEINRVAKENNCEVINILDKESPFYECGPSEFLYLEKNAFLICTDSFHSSVFGILYNTPFLVFEREDNNASMNSRLDTLLSKFKLEDRRYKGKITKKDLKCDYKEAYNILDKERIKSMNFLKKALDIRDSDKNE